MVTSIILISSERNKISQVALKLQEISSISEVYMVSGKYDMVAIVRVKNNDDLASLVTQQMLTIEGIMKTETMVAFQAFSRHNLESIFATGL